MNEPVVVEKRKPGRPKNPATISVDNSAAPKASKFKMKAKPNWEDLDPSAMGDTPDRLRIEQSETPDGMDLQWVTDSVYGQSMSQHRSTFERKGWTPVHPSDFDGRFDGKFTPRGAEGEIIVDGLVLMARPMEITKKARLAERRQAIEQVSIKEQAWRSGDINTSLDSRHSSALNTNKINKSMERISIPED